MFSATLVLVVGLITGLVSAQLPTNHQPLHRRLQQTPAPATPLSGGALATPIPAIDGQAIHKVRVSALKGPTTSTPRIIPIFSDHPTFPDSDDNISSLTLMITRSTRDNVTRLYASDQVLPAWAAAGLTKNDTVRIMISAVNTVTQYNAIFRAIFLHTNTTSLHKKWTVVWNFTSHVLSVDGHFYVVQSETALWSVSMCDRLPTLYGLKPYLATITSAAEFLTLGEYLRSLPG